MEPDQTQITHDLPPFFRIHSSGRVERYSENDFMPPSYDHKTGVVSKDVVISPGKVSARIYLPQTTETDRKLPLIVYIHGGAFTLQSAFSSLYHPYINSLSSKSRSVVVSIEYRLAPEHPIPACYDDCYAALEWVNSHSRAGTGPDPWLNEHAEFQRVYMAGDSAGANIVHNMAIRANSGLNLKIAGLILVHPFFGNGKPDKLWEFICPDSGGADDVRLNPTAAMELLAKLGCERVLICVGEKDFLRKRGWNYYEGLKRSDWKGVVEFFETPEEEHVFHLFKPDSGKASLLMKRIVDWINSGVHVILSHV